MAEQKEEEEENNNNNIFCFRNFVSLSLSLSSPTTLFIQRLFGSKNLFFVVVVVKLHHFISFFSTKASKVPSSLSLSSSSINPLLSFSLGDDGTHKKNKGITKNRPKKQDNHDNDEQLEKVKTK